MEPTTAAAVGAVKVASELSIQYGIAVVLCFTMIIFFGLILRWVFRFMDKLVNDTLAKVTATIAALNLAIVSLNQAISQANANQTLAFERVSLTMAEGFSGLQQANIFQKDEHKEIRAMQVIMDKTIAEKFTQVSDKITTLGNALECRAK